MNENQKIQPCLENIDNHIDVFTKKYNTINNKKSTHSFIDQYNKKDNNALVEMYAEIVSVIVNDYFD